ncbi:MAG: TolB-like 6-bladed beta-propeller domain-containing protein [Paramuribaculum sp.]|nr:TolB-like 6-bladed beta-propeller domain-containing protein [Paramuribaculum sp.]
MDINQKRGNYIDVSDMIDEFSLEDVLIGSDVGVTVTDNKLVITDYESIDKILSVFSVPDGQFLGSFGNYGPGPYDIGIPGEAIVYADSVDGREKALMFNFAQYSVLKFDIDSAICQTDYLPVRMKSTDSKVLPSYYQHINDTLGFAKKIVMSPDGNGFSQSLGRYNISTGELTDFAPEEAIEGNYSSFAICPEINMLVEAGQRVDIIKIYDLDGNVKKRIKGPNYRPEPKGGKAYFSDVCFTDKYILCVYSGENWNGGSLGKKIVVLDMDGNYLATLDTKRKIRNMAYHSPSSTLYMAFPSDEMQVGMLNINDVIEGKMDDDKSKSHSEESRPNKRNDVKNTKSFRFLRADNMAVIDRLVCDTIDIYEGYETTCPPNTKIIPRYFKQPGFSDTLRIKSIKTSHEFLHLNLLVKHFTPGMITSGEICFDENIPEGDFKGSVEIVFDNPDVTAILPVEGYIRHIKIE